MAADPNPAARFFYPVTRNPNITPTFLYPMPVNPNKFSPSPGPMAGNPDIIRARFSRFYFNDDSRRPSFYINCPGGTTIGKT